MMPLNGLNVKAIWTKASYTVTFDTGGGSSIDPLTLPYLEGLPEIEVPTKEGYIFWWLGYYITRYNAVKRT